MPSRSGDRPKASEKIAEMRARETRRRRLRRWLAGIGALVVVAAAVIGIVLGTAGGGVPKAGSSTPPRPKLASLSGLGRLAAAPPAGPIGPEGVPIPKRPR